jgi:peptidoglycan/LPS O-acetylase OafA/YrhL
VLPNGTVGVSVFFALSGYLICGMLLALDRTPANALRFIFRRLMRVWPMMAVQIALTGLLMAALVPSRLTVFLHDLPYFLTFTGSYSEWSGLSPAVLWTLMAEFWFYVLFSLAWLLTNSRFLLAAIIGGIAAGFFFKASLGHYYDANEINIGCFAPLRFTLVYFDQLMYGALCAWLVRFRPNIAAAFDSRAFLWLPLAAIAALAAFRVNTAEPLFYINTSAAAFLTSIAILHNSANSVRGDFEPVATLGKISYSIYLLHAFTFDFMPLPQSPALAFEMAAAVTILASLATYRWIELPFIRLSKRIAPFTSKPIANLTPQGSWSRGFATVILVIGFVPLTYIWSGEVWNNLGTPPLRAALEAGEPVRLILVCPGIAHLKCDRPLTLSYSRDGGRWCEHTKIEGEPEYVAHWCNADLDKGQIGLAGAVFNLDFRGNVERGGIYAGRLERR